MRKIFWSAIVLIGTSLTTACTDYQDEIDALDYRITVLEKMVKQVNVDMESMQVIAAALEQSDYVTDVTQNSEGYIISFLRSGSIFIRDGKDGRDGEDAKAPDVGIAQDTDGLWYWTLNGEWILAGGEKIRANGKDGKDGRDAVTPQVRISDQGIWEISVDGGQTWSSTGTSATGRDGRDGVDGEDGEDGKDAKQLFASVTYEVTSEGEFMVIVTNSGHTFRIPIYENV